MRCRAPPPSGRCSARESGQSLPSTCSRRLKTPPLPPDNPQYRICGSHCLGSHSCYFLPRVARSPARPWSRRRRRPDGSQRSQQSAYHSDRMLKAQSLFRTLTARQSSCACRNVQITALATTATYLMELATCEKNVVRLGADQLHGAQCNDKDYRQHYGIFGDILSGVVVPSFCDEFDHDGSSRLNQPRWAAMHLHPRADKTNGQWPKVERYATFVTGRALPDGRPFAGVALR